MSSIEEIMKKEIVYKIDKMDEVKVQKNIVYKVQNNSELLMDLYSPMENLKKNKLPVVILIHGEAANMNFKEAGQYVSYGKLIAANGYSAVTFNHRTLSDKFKIEDVKNDISDLIGYVIKNAEKLNIDKNKIVIWCFSGGVPFGLYVGIHDYYASLKGIIAYYGFADFLSISKLIPEYTDLNDMEKYSPLNEIKRIKKQVPPLLIARAGMDNRIINDSMDNFIKEALKNNININIYNNPDGVHGFDLFNDDKRTYEIIEESISFLNKRFC